MPPANGMHINTNGRRASGLENRVPAWVSKDRCRATWKSRETRQSSRRRPCGYQRPLVQYCSTRPDKTPSWGLWSKHRAARQARCGVRRAHHFYCHCRLSALRAPFGFALSSKLMRFPAQIKTIRSGVGSGIGLRVKVLSAYVDCQPLTQLRPSTTA